MSAVRPAALEAKGGPDGAYGHVQATRPATLAAALNDSPAGLLAWIAEKLVAVEARSAVESDVTPHGETFVRMGR